MKRGTLLAAKVAVSLALLGYLLSTADLPALVRRVREGDVLLLAAGVGLYAAMLALSTWRWRLLLAAQGFPASLRALSASYLIATFFNNFLPSNIGGDVVRVRDSSKLTGSTTTSLAVVAIDRILGLSALYALAFSAFVLGGSGVVYRGMELLGGGAILAGMILGAIGAFVIDRDFNRAAVYSLAGAVLSYFGFIHGAKLGIGESVEVALGYVLLAVIFWGLAQREGVPKPAS